MVTNAIFIGGTRYSGSTFFDMILSNDESGFSCGEIISLFHPYKKHHFSPACSCGDKECNIWSYLKSNSEKYIFRSISQIVEGTDFYVDSSKEPFWIRRQNKLLKDKNIKTRNILIWKSPIEFAFSYSKRNLPHWEKDWIQYHRRYFSLINDWKSIAYSELTSLPIKLKDACDWAGIKYYDGKHQFWTKTHHTLFGNINAKIHLYNEKESSFVKMEKIMNKRDDPKGEKHLNYHKSIYYIPVDNEEIISHVTKMINTNQVIKDILETLKNNDVSNCTVPTEVKSNLKFNSITIFLKNFKFILRRKMQKLKSLQTL